MASLKVEAQTKAEIGARVYETVSKSAVTKKEIASLWNVSERQVDRIYCGDTLIDVEKLLALRDDERIKADCGYILNGESAEPDYYVKNLDEALEKLNDKRLQDKFGRRILSIAYKYISKE